MMSQNQPQKLIAGANAPLPTDNISIRILSQNAIDCAAYRLTNDGKVRGDGDMIFYGQTRSMMVALASVVMTVMDFLMSICLHSLQVLRKLP
ncbi:hypothetical protein [Psychrobacter sp. JCM 18900]|uniref:hypothetical protein n=1 Tax=Psychrobacter sp. JCM 18900 TaxID=1298608 RepID=UPI00272EC05F|nr:hypothetical protein [Psychrobacter sp. JCM 18900]